VIALADVMAPLTNPAQTGLLDSCLTNKLHRLSLATFDDEGNYVTYLVTCHYIASLTPVRCFTSFPWRVGLFLGEWGGGEFPALKGKTRKEGCFVSLCNNSDFLFYSYSYHGILNRTLPYIDGVLGGNQVICQQLSFHRR
jgi:hypothetical protein